ncbi:MAG: preprotein translocase subunit YajC [Bdellovibrionota bacterium]
MMKIHMFGWVVSAWVLSSMVYALNALAEGNALPVAPVPGGNQTPQPAAPSLAMNMVPMIVIFGIIYFMMLRPQQKKMKEQQNMISTLKHGDEIVTASGILGKITGITDKVVTLEVANDVRLKMMKSQVAQVIKGQIKDLA